MSPEKIVVHQTNEGCFGGCAKYLLLGFLALLLYPIYIAWFPPKQNNGAEITATANTPPPPPIESPTPTPIPVTLLDHVVTSNTGLLTLPAGSPFQIITEHPDGTVTISSGGSEWTVPRSILPLEGEAPPEP
jgi:hypothetical protein